jgi:hypothetical protein
MQPRSRPPVWLWFNLLGLDAPLIALVWQDFVARCYPSALHAGGRGVLFLTVWAIYLADRILDAHQPARPGESLRHDFYRRHRTFTRSLLAAVVFADLVTTELWLRPGVFEDGLLLSAGVVAYLGAFPLRGWDAPAWKKPLAALLFTAGTFLIAWTEVNHPLRHLGLPAAEFFALCFGNLLVIAGYGRVPQSGMMAGKWIWFAFLPASLGVVHPSAWLSAILLSAAGLAVLGFAGRNHSVDVRCVLADAMLLTPLLFR